MRLTFTTAPDYENPDDADGDNVYAVTVQVSDGDNTDMATLEVTVENVIELATEMTGPATVEYAENRAVRVATYTASSEEDRAGITWNLSGDDAEHFSIDNPAGVLRFHIDPDDDLPFPKLPDFEAPDDEDDDNVYELTLLARAALRSHPQDCDRHSHRRERGRDGLAGPGASPARCDEVTATLSDPDYNAEVTGTTYLYSGSAQRAATPGRSSPERRQPATRRRPPIRAPTCV